MRRRRTPSRWRTLGRIKRGGRRALTRVIEAAPIRYNLDGLAIILQTVGDFMPPLSRRERRLHKQVTYDFDPVAFTLTMRPASLYTDGSVS